MTARIERPDPDDARPALVVLEMSSDDLDALARQGRAGAQDALLKLWRAIRKAAGE